MTIRVHCPLPEGVALCPPLGVEQAAAVMETGFPPAIRRGLAKTTSATLEEQHLRRPGPARRPASIGPLLHLVRRHVSTKKKLKLSASPGVSIVNARTAKQLRDRLHMKADDRRINLQDVHRASPPDCSTRGADPLHQTVVQGLDSLLGVFAVVALCPAAVHPAGHRGTSRTTTVPGSPLAPQPVFLR